MQEVGFDRGRKIPVRNLGGPPPVYMLTGHLPIDAHTEFPAVPVRVVEEDLLLRPEVLHRLAEAVRPASGQVPAADIFKLLTEKPNARGLSVPGMPIGSPGMEMGNNKEPFDTLLVFENGKTKVFNSHAQPPSV